MDIYDGNGGYVIFKNPVVVPEIDPIINAEYFDIEVTELHWVNGGTNHTAANCTSYYYNMDGVVDEYVKTTKPFRLLRFP